MNDTSPPPADRDPLVHSRADMAARVGFVAALAVAAVVAHAAAMGVISGASWLAGTGGGDKPASERVSVDIVEPEPPPAPEPPPPPPEPPTPEPPAETAPKPKPVVKRPPKPAPTKPRVASKPKPPPADPINQPNKPAPEPAKPVRRTIGLNLESTVEGGDGPSFNTGNTRMGQTARVANDPNKVDRRKPVASPTPPTPKAPPSRNRAAAHIPSAGIKLVRPKRIARVKPVYPAVLRARNIEGTVVVRVHIDARGKVTKVDIVAAAKHAEFNAAARAAALTERFRPATKNGAAIPYAISFSYRFRLNDA